MSEWMKNHGGLLVAVSVSLFVSTLAIGLWIALRLPADYLNRPDPPRRDGGFIAIARSVAKNVAGAGLIGLGLLISLPLVPGPGLLLVVVGLSLMSFPGKRKLEHKLVGNRFVLRSLNRVRAMAGRPVLEEPARPRAERSGRGRPGSAVE